MTAHLSVCIITRGEPTLEAAVASVRPYVKQVCLTYTGTDDKRAREVELLADAYSRCVDCNDDEGQIVDFSRARTASFALATEPWSMWMDSDDAIVGGKHLADVLRDSDRKERPRLICKYDYCHDQETDETLVVQWRERIIKTGSPYVWKRPVHEHLVAIDGRNEDVVVRDLIWVHQRKSVEADRGRNLRILMRHAADVGDISQDAWLLYNLGREMHRNGHFAGAIEVLQRYLPISGRDDEKLRAMVHIARCHMALAMGTRYDDAIHWARKAVEAYPNEFESHYALSSMLYLRGMTGDEDALRESNASAARALATPYSRTPMDVEPFDRTLHVHNQMRNVAQMLGDWETAERAATEALKARPGDPELTLARKGYAQAHYLASLVSAPKQDVQTGLDVVIVCGPTPEPWNPEVHAKRGLGGSETAVVEMAKRLAARGCRVRVYCDTPKEGTWDGVDYYHWNQSRPDKCDVLISWRTAKLLMVCPAKVRLVWAHDVTVPGMTYPQAIRADRILALSEWHKRNLMQAHGLHESHVWVTRNGIDPARFQRDDVKRDPHRVLYTSSPDRGLAVLLDMWPRIRERVPDASLRVFYGFAGWSMSAEARHDEHERYLIRSLQARMKEMPGVEYVGSVDQGRLAKEMLGAGVWALPTWFEETFCIGAAEAQAAGMRVVCTRLAALREIAAPYCTLVTGDWLSDEYQDTFVKEVVDAMHEQGVWQGAPSREAHAATSRERFSWEGVADEWISMFNELLEEAKAGAMPEYKAVA